MKLSIVAHSLTNATRETMEDVANKSFKRLSRLVVQDNNKEPEVRISAEQEGKEFVVTAELHTYKIGNLISKCRNRDLRIAINDCSKELKMILSKEKDKLVSRRKLAKPNLI